MVAVLADRNHRRRLRALDAGLLGEANFVANRERCTVDHAVAVEVDLPAIRVEVSPLAFDVEIGHATMLRLDMGLDVCALAAGVVLELPASSAEGIADRDV